MCSRCETESMRFNCCEGCNHEACCEMGGDNCKAAPRCCYCPIVHVCYGFTHCRLCCSKPEALSPELLVKHVELEHDDKCFGDSHRMGALCLPCTMVCCVLGVPGCALTYVGAFCCCSTGCCCKGVRCCKSCCKKDRQTAPITEQPIPTCNLPQPEPVATI